MITIVILGIDPYGLCDLSRDLTSPIANLCEVKPEDINFYAPEGLLVHNGVVQNSWNSFVKVIAPKKVQVLQKDIAKIISTFLSSLSIHCEIVFSYYLHDEREVFVNKDYSRFIDEKNSVEVQETETDDINDVYTENVFENIDEKMKNNNGENK